MNFGRMGAGFGRLGSPGGAVIPQRVIGTKFGPNGGANGTGFAGDASHAAATSRTRIDMPAYDVELKWIEYWNGRINFAGNGEVTGPNSINVKAAWESAAGVNSPLYAADLTNRTCALSGGARQRFYPA